MKLSVIIPTYNCQEHLMESVATAYINEGQDSEIIIVDDGSTDNTPKRVKQLLLVYPNIRYIQQKNKGPGAARNCGLKAAQGEYIAFLDADDRLLKGSLEERMLLLDKNPDIEMVFTDYYVVRNIKDKIGNESRLACNPFLETLFPLKNYEANGWFQTTIDTYRYYLSYSPNPVSTITVMLRRSVLNKIGYFRTDINISEDRDYWMRILKKCQVAFIGKPLAVYQNYNSDLTKRKKQAYENIVISLVPLQQDPLIPKNIVKNELSDVYYNFAHYCLDNKQFLASRKYFIKAIMYRPTVLKYWVCLLSPSKYILQGLRSVKRACRKGNY